jgi:hypothetical protein
MLTADRNTHIKIVVMALIGGVLVMTVGIMGSLGDKSQFAGVDRVDKAGQPVSISRNDVAVVR